MSNNYKITLSEAFLDRLPAEKRVLMATRAQALITSIIEQDETFTRMVMRIFGGDTHAYTGQRVEYHLEELLDMDAKIELRTKGRKYNVSVLTAMCLDKNIPEEFLTPCVSMISEREDLGASELFASPAACAAGSNNIYMLCALATNPRLNPNEVVDGTKEGPFTAWEHGGTYSPLKPIHGDNIREQTTTLGALCNELDKRKLGNRTHCHDQLLRQSIKSLINMGGKTSAFQHELSGDLGQPVRRHIIELRHGAEALDPTNCTLEEFLKAYAVNMHSPAFTQAMDDTDAQAHMLELYEEMPQWLQEELAPAYDILKANTWAARSFSGDARDRGGRG